VALRNQGTLTVISLQRAETDPSASVAATVMAGCNPVRVITSADGREVWVTARESDDLLCFSAAALPDDPARALVAPLSPSLPARVPGGGFMIVGQSGRYGHISK
jgi:hypothetical protein